MVVRRWLYCVPQPNLNSRLWATWRSLLLRRVSLLVTVLWGCLELFHKLYHGAAPQKTGLCGVPVLSQLHPFFSNWVRGAETVWLKNIERSWKTWSRAVPNTPYIYSCVALLIFYLSAFIWAIFSHKLFLNRERLSNNRVLFPVYYSSSSSLSLIVHLPSWHKSQIINHTNIFFCERTRIKFSGQCWSWGRTSPELKH